MSQSKVPPPLQIWPPWSLLGPGPGKRKVKSKWVSSRSSQGMGPLHLGGVLRACTFSNPHPPTSKRGEGCRAHSASKHSRRRSAIPFMRWTYGRGLELLLPRSLLGRSFVLTRHLVPFGHGPCCTLSSSALNPKWSFPLSLLFCVLTLRVAGQHLMCSPLVGEYSSTGGPWHTFLIHSSTHRIFHPLVSLNPTHEASTPFRPIPTSPSHCLP